MDFFLFLDHLCVRGYKGYNFVAFILFIHSNKTSGIPLPSGYFVLIR